MKQLAVAAIAFLFILGASGCASEQHASRDRGRAQDSLALMTKQDVIRLSKAGVGNEVILSMIEITGSTFPMRTQDVIELADSGVTDTVIHAMIHADGSTSKADRKSVIRRYGPDYGWWYGARYYDPWYWGGFYSWPGPYYGPRVRVGFHWGGRHR